MRVWRRLLSALLSVAFLLSLTPAAAAQTAPPAYTPEASSAILMDFNTRTILYELNPDQQIPPASLTKLMTIWLASKALREGRLKPDDPVQITEDAWFRNPKFGGSSGMFLEPGQRVTVAEILKGIAIVSGNDACVALAQHMAGSVDAFVAQMNAEARELGLTATRFVDPHGLSEANVTTARDMLRLAEIYIENFPENLASLHSQKQFTYPQPHNLNQNQQGRQPITQNNWNKLLFDPDLKVDGLKTGYIRASGYNLIVTATEDDRRLLGVLFGTNSETHRAAQGKALLLYGFRNFENVTPLKGDEQLAEVQVWKGAANAVKAVPAGPVTLTLPRGDGERIIQVVESESELVAPVAKGQTVGVVILKLGDKEIKRVPLVTAEAVEAGGWWKRLIDTLRLFFRSIVARFSGGEA